MIYFLIVVPILLAILWSNRKKTKFPSKRWQRAIIALSLYLLVFVILSIFSRLLAFDQLFPLHLDWEYRETIENDDALAYIYQSNDDSTDPHYSIMVFQKFSFLVMPWPGYDYPLGNFDILLYSGTDDTYDDNKAQTIIYKIGKDKYLVYLRIYDGQELDVTDIAYDNHSVDFQISDTDSNMIFFITDTLTFDLTINNLAFDSWN